MSEPNPRKTGQRQRWVQASDRVLRDQQQAAHHQHLKQAQWDTDARLARSTIDLAARVGELALATGATSSDATQMTLQVARSSGLNVHINITFTCVTITEHRVEDDPITTMRVVKARTVDYERLSRLAGLVDRFSRGVIDLEQARAGFDGLLDTSPNYRFWVLSLSAFVMGASMTVLLGGNWQTTLAAGFATTAADLLVGWSVRKGLPYFFVIALAAAVPTVCALTVMALRAYTRLPVWAISPSLIVAAGMMSLLAGLGVVTAAREAIDGYYITAGARTFEVIVLTMAIVLGLLATLWLGLQIGIPGYLAPRAGFSDSVLVQVSCAAIIALSFAVSGHLGPRSLFFCAALGALLWLGYHAMMLATGNHPASAGVAAVGVGFVAQLLANRWKLPVIALVSAGIAPLMPGLVLYRGIYALVENQENMAGADSGMPLLMLAVFTGLALAAGSTLGNFLARPIPELQLRGRRGVVHAPATGS